MGKRVLAICFALTALCSRQAHAQFTDPRNFANTPVGVSELELDYAYSHTNASIESSLIVPEANFHLNAGAIRYTRYFGLMHRLAWVQPSLPIANLNGSISGTNISRSITGVGDTTYEFAMLLKGGPALSVSEFESYKPVTSIGVSLDVTAPTGQYTADNQINLGSNRWTFTPQIGVSYPFGAEKRWVCDGYANAGFFTGNGSYQGRTVLRQQALPGVEGHISYSFNDRVWASGDTRYSFLGSTTVDGVGQNDTQHNFIVGSQLNMSLNSRNVLVIEFSKAVVHQHSEAFTGFAVKYFYSWQAILRKR